MQALRTVLPLALLLPSAAVLGPSGCSRPVDAVTKSEIEKLLRDLVEASNEMDLDRYVAAFDPACPVTIESCGKTKRTTIGEYRKSLEEAMGVMKENRVVLGKVEIRPGGRGYLVRAEARERTVQILGRVFEGESTNDFEIERRDGSYRVVAYTSRLTITKFKDPLIGEVDPRTTPILDWTDPEAR